MARNPKNGKRLFIIRNFLKLPPWKKKYHEIQPTKKCDLNYNLIRTFWSIVQINWNDKKKYGNFITDFCEIRINSIFNSHDIIFFDKTVFFFNVSFFNQIINTTEFLRCFFMFLPKNPTRNFKNLILKNGTVPTTK